MSNKTAFSTINMDNNINKCIALTYSLYANVEGENELLEVASEKEPFRFVSDMGFALPLFEEAVANLAQGEEFDFVIPKDDAYGDYVEERIVELDKNIFMRDGKLDEKVIHVDAIIPLVNEDGNRFNGRILEIGDKEVSVDLNHPYAGLDLHFVGKILENRDATPQEMEQIMKMMSGEGCGGCGGGDCGGCGGGDCGGCGGGC